MHFNYRTWITRRVVWTNDCIHISRKNEEIVIDSIPLAEVILISVYGEGGSESALHSTSQNWTSNMHESPRRKSSYVHPIMDDDSQSSTPRPKQTQGGLPAQGARSASAADEEAVLQISTVPDGFNSGAPTPHGPPIQPLAAIRAQPACPRFLKFSQRT